MHELNINIPLYHYLELSFSLNEVPFTESLTNSFTTHSLTLRQRFAVLAITLLFVDRFGRFFIWFFHLEFDKETISDGFMANEFELILES